MIRNGYRNHRRLGQTNPCPPGLVQNGDSCIDPTQWQGICQPNYQAVAPNGGPLTAAQQAAGQFTCVPMSTGGGGAPSPATAIPASPGPPVVVTPAPVIAAPLSTPPPASSTTNYSAQEIAGSFNYTADLETVQNEMNLYGDTWDNAQTIVNDLYSSGIAPGTVTPAIAFSMLTGLAAATTTTTSTASLLSSVSTWPWYYWAALAGGGLLLFGGSGSGRK
jgi:hypothetical protein